jgi:hypothetical protein
VHDLEPGFVHRRVVGHHDAERFRQGRMQELASLWIGPDVQLDRADPELVELLGQRPVAVLETSRN